MLATIKADLALVEAYVASHYKQLTVAAIVGKFSSWIVAAVLALVHTL